ncbi:MAG: ATP-binding protein [Paludibacteraceae bacterium]|nr:ATP-binding protein [Paludibacteraceae bacterium]
MSSIIQRSENKVLEARINEPRKFIQVIIGPRQVGKTTMVKQVIEKQKMPVRYYSAENIVITENWIENIWQSARMEMRTQHYPQLLLVIDEVQKVSNWSEKIKNEWDSDTWNNIPIKVILLGSSRMMIMHGLTESLAGRFEIIRMSHWTYTEMQEAFDWSLSDFIYFGGYPSTAEMINDENRWRQYVQDSLLEASINKDVMQTSNIYKPALLRQLFVLSCSYSTDELSFRKVMGMLQDAGNATTLASYLQLLDEANLVCGLQKYAHDKARKYSSSPKFQVYNNALLNVYNQYSYQDVRMNPQQWGRQVESAVGAYLLCEAEKQHMQVFYWRENNAEVDFVVENRGQVIGIEVKSNGVRSNAGLHLFQEKYNPKAVFVVGDAGIPLHIFLKSKLKDFFE